MQPKDAAKYLLSYVIRFTIFCLFANNALLDKQRDEKILEVGMKAQFLDLPLVRLVLHKSVEHIQFVPINFRMREAKRRISELVHSQNKSSIFRFFQYSDYCHFV